MQNGPIGSRDASGPPTATTHRCQFNGSRLVLRHATAFIRRMPRLSAEPGPRSNPKRALSRSAPRRASEHLHQTLAPSTSGRAAAARRQSSGAERSDGWAHAAVRVQCGNWACRVPLAMGPRRGVQLAGVFPHARPSPPVPSPLSSTYSPAA